METVTAWNCHPDCPVRILDEQTGELKSGKAAKGGHKRSAENMEEAAEDGSMVFGGGKGMAGTSSTDDAGTLYGDKGGASRFFYQAKASKSEREAGLEGMDEKLFAQSNGGQTDTQSGEERYDTKEGIGLNKVKKRKNIHPTVKPVALMEYLCRLITPPGGVVLDPFMGSGTTGIAAIREGFAFIGIEKMDEYLPIAKARIEHALRGDQ